MSLFNGMKEQKYCTLDIEEVKLLPASMSGEDIEQPVNPSRVSLGKTAIQYNCFGCSPVNDRENTAVLPPLPFVLVPVATY